jgi:hypothetical protein
MSTMPKKIYTRYGDTRQRQTKSMARQRMRQACKLQQFIINRQKGERPRPQSSTFRSFQDHVRQSSGISQNTKNHSINLIIKEITKRPSTAHQLTSSLTARPQSQLKREMRQRRASLSQLMKRKMLEFIKGNDILERVSHYPREILWLDGTEVQVLVIRS